MNDYIIRFITDEQREQTGNRQTQGLEQDGKGRKRQEGRRTHFRTETGKRQTHSAAEAEEV